ELGLGQSSAVGIGGDSINGLKHIDVLKMFNDDPDTDAVVMIGEIGGPDEVNAALWAKDNMKKPVVGFIAGVTAPPGKRMGHAGALISGGADTADAKLEVMEACGIRTTRDPSEMGKLLKSVLYVLWRPSQTGPHMLRFRLVLQREYDGTLAGPCGDSYKKLNYNGPLFAPSAPVARGPLSLLNASRQRKHLWLNFFRRSTGGRFSRSS